MTPAQPFLTAEAAIRSPIRADSSDPPPSTTSTAPAPGVASVALTRALSRAHRTVRIGPSNAVTPPKSCSCSARESSSSPRSSYRSAVAIVMPLRYCRALGRLACTTQEGCRFFRPARGIGAFDDGSVLRCARGAVSESSSPDRATPSPRRCSRPIVKHDRTHPVDRHRDTADDDHAGPHPRLLRPAARHRPTHPASDPRDVRRRRDRATPHRADRARRRRRTRDGHLRRRRRCAPRPRHGAAQRRVHPPRARAVAAGGTDRARRGRGGGIRDHARRDRLVHRMLRPGSRFPHRPRPRAGAIRPSATTWDSSGAPAAFPALRAAERFCAAQPGRGRARRVHRAVQPAHPPEHLPDQIVSSSVFADGSAAAIVTAAPARPPGPRSRALRARPSRARARATWRGRSATTGSRWCSPARCRASSAARSAGRSTASSATTVPTAWAVHPGGRSILDRVQAGLDLAPDALATSRGGAARLRQHVERDGDVHPARHCCTTTRSRSGATIAGLAFGPGPDRRVRPADQAHRRGRPAPAHDRHLAGAR